MVSFVILTIEQMQFLKETPNSAYSYIKPEFLFHSNKMEGSTFTEDELEKLIDEGIVTGSHSFDDVIETRNSIEVFDYLVDTLGEPISNEFIIKLNTMLLKNTENDALGFVGHFKERANRIIGTAVQTALPSEVEPAINELMESWNSSNKDFEAIGSFHIRFEHIHPFQEGNGRIGRFLMFKQCIEEHVDLIVIDEKYNEPYKAWLEIAQTQGNSRFFLETLHKCQDYFEQKLEKNGIARLIPSLEECRHSTQLRVHERIKGIAPFPSNNPDLTERDQEKRDYKNRDLKILTYKK